MQQIQSVVKHEFGHALGLGHYKADDIDVSVAWARGTISKVLVWRERILA